MTAQRLIAEVFGIELARTQLGVPEAATLLGLSINAPDSAVIDALKACLRKLDAHPLGRDEGGVEARVMLHAAAARLLEHADGRAPDGGISLTPPQDATNRPGLAHELARTIVHGGGWNRASMSQFAAIARREGLAMEELLGVLRQLQQGGTHAAPPLAPPSAQAAANEPPRPRGPAAITPAAPRPQAPTKPPAPLQREPVPASEDIDDLSSLANEPPNEPSMDNSGVAKALVALVAVGIAVSLIFAAILLVLFMTLRGTPQAKDLAEASGADAAPSSTAPAPGPSAASDTQSSPSPDTIKPIPTADSASNTDFAALQRDLRARVEGLATDPAQAAEGFDLLLNAIADRWPEGAADGSLVVVVGDLVEFVYRASTASGGGGGGGGGGQESGRRAVSFIADLAQPIESTTPLDAASVRRGAFIAGLATRLMRERDLPAMSWTISETAYRRSFQGATAPSETTFAAGASVWSTAALPRLVLARPGTPDDIAANSRAAWGAWLSVVQALAPEGSRERERAILAALDTVITTGPETTDARWAYEAVEALTLRLTWRPTDESRRWLLRWFASPAVTTSDLHTLTRILAEKSNAEGIDLSMVLSRTAGEGERTQLRERYSVVWGISTPARGELITKWLEAANLDLSREIPADHVAALASTVRLARLSRAARLIQSGEVGEADALIRSQTPQATSAAAPAPVSTATPGIIATLTVSGAGASSVPSGWAPRYLAAGQNIPIRKEILAGISSIPTQIEADVLVEEAARGAPWQVRQSARALVERYSQQRTIVEAMLKFAPLLPPTPDNALLAEAVSGARLPSARSPQWRVALRRALVERLIQSLASSGDARSIDELSRLLSDAYAPTFLPAENLSGPASADPSQTPTPIPADPSLEDAARNFRMTLESQSASALSSGREPISREKIAANIAVRSRVAAGRIQDFAAEQAAIAEHLAFLTSIENSSAARQITAILQELDQSRRTTTHIFAQINATERAIVSLWKIRLGGSEP